VANRSTLIKDDDDDEGNDAEQSDIVSLMLNLAFIPEEASNKFEFKVGKLAALKEGIQNYKVQKGLTMKSKIN